MTRFTESLLLEGAQKIEELRADKAALIVILRECEAYFEPRADAEIFYDGACGNDEMSLLCEIREGLKRFA